MNLEMMLTSRRDKVFGIFMAFALSNSVLGAAAAGSSFRWLQNRDNAQYAAQYADVIDHTAILQTDLAKVATIIVVFTILVFILACINRWIYRPAGKRQGVYRVLTVLSDAIMLRPIFAILPPIRYAVMTKTTNLMLFGICGYYLISAAVTIFLSSRVVFIPARGARKMEG